MNMHAKIKPQTKERVIPQGYTDVDELAAIRTLLRNGRIPEAMQRLDVFIDRTMPSWRTG